MAELLGAEPFPGREGAAAVALEKGRESRTAATPTPCPLGWVAAPAPLPGTCPRWAAEEPLLVGKGG